MQGDQPVRLFHYSYLPLALSAVPDPDYFFNNPRHTPDDLSEQEDFYSEAKMVQSFERDEALGMRVYWYGNFFPDMRAWDKLEANVRRGAGGKSVYIQFPHSEVSAHMSVFAGADLQEGTPPRPRSEPSSFPPAKGTPSCGKKAKTKSSCPWHECSLFVPPNRWFHQHFNVGGSQRTVPGPASPHAVPWPCGEG